MGFTGGLSHCGARLRTLMEKVLPHLSSLRSLDLGDDTGIGLPCWHIATISSLLTYLRAPVQNMRNLCDVMSTETLPRTLEQLHVTLRNLDIEQRYISPKGLIMSNMNHLHTFTLVQSIFADGRIQWSTIELLTGPNVMPRLRRLNLAVFVTVDDLARLKESSLFTVDRQIDVQFAFIVDDDSLGTLLSDYIPSGSRFHPRQLVGATCVARSLTERSRQMTNVDYYVSDRVSFEFYERRTYPVLYFLL
jgi:hypothetical protein